MQGWAWVIRIFSDGLALSSAGRVQGNKKEAQRREALAQRLLKVMGLQPPPPAAALLLLASSSRSIEVGGGPTPTKRSRAAPKAMWALDISGAAAFAIICGRTCDGMVGCVGTRCTIPASETQARLVLCRFYLENYGAAKSTAAAGVPRAGRGAGTAGARGPDGPRPAPHQPRTLSLTTEAG